MEKQKLNRRFAHGIVRSLWLGGVVAGLVGSSFLGAEMPTSSLSTVAPFSQSSTLVGDAEEGEASWVTYYCYSCHGWSGNGGAGPPVSSPVFTMEGFIRYVRNPVRMPPYVNRVMSDQQLADVYEYLLTVPPSPDAESIPLLRELLEDQ